MAINDKNPPLKDGSIHNMLSKYFLENLDIAGLLAFRGGSGNLNNTYK